MASSTMLLCEDFLPSRLADGNPPKFAPFSDSVSRANRWLHEHPEVAVLKCETIRAVASSHNGQDGNTHTMSYPAGKPKDVKRFSLRGLRIWYQKQPGQEKRHSEPPQITSIDVLPKEQDDMVESFPDVLAHLNAQIADYKSQQLLNIQTLAVPRDKKEMDSEETVLAIQTPTKLVHFLRAYLITSDGAELPPEVHVQDFIPHQVTAGKVSTFSTIFPAFESLSETFAKADKWIQANPNISLINVELSDLLLNEELSYCGSDTQKCFFSAKKPPFGWLKIVRIYYHTTKQGSTPDGKLVSLSFSPEVKEKKSLFCYAQYEELGDVLRKVQVKCEGLGGVYVGVQSIWTYPEWESGKDVFQPNTSLHIEPRLDGTDLLPQLEIIHVSMVVQ